LYRKCTKAASVIRDATPVDVDDTVWYGGGGNIRRRFRFVVSIHGEVFLVAKSLVFVREMRSLLNVELADGIFTSFLPIKKCVLTVPGL
jgi:hypothetical protein